jgi:hypothetical protein
VWWSVLEIHSIEWKLRASVPYGVRIEFERGVCEPILRVGNSLHRVETESICMV